MSDKIRSYVAGALVTNAVEACRSLNLEGENLHDGYYTVQMPVKVDGKIQLMECRFKKVITGGEWCAATLSEVVNTCAQLGDMVRIMKPEQGEKDKGERDSKPICYGSRPGPQDQSMNGCYDCKFRKDCLTD